MKGDCNLDCQQGYVGKGMWFSERDLPFCRSSVSPGTRVNDVHPNVKGAAITQLRTAGTISVVAGPARVRSVLNPGGPNYGKHRQFMFRRSSGERDW